ncbi:MAG: hypothetical protein U0K35_07630, partial [Prevotella sp.]|nr:hypothetical protein [Prevotella sp.]
EKCSIETPIFTKLTSLNKKRGCAYFDTPSFCCLYLQDLSVRHRQIFLATAVSIQKIFEICKSL